MAQGAQMAPETDGKADWDKTLKDEYLIPGVLAKKSIPSHTKRDGMPPDP